MPVFQAYNTQKTLLQKSHFMQGLDALVGVILFCKLRRKKIEKPPETYCFRWFCIWRILVCHEFYQNRFLCVQTVFCFVEDFVSVCFEYFRCDFFASMSG